MSHFCFYKLHHIFHNLSIGKEDVCKTKEGSPKESREEERKVNGEVSREDDEVESEAELDMGEKNSASHRETTASAEKGEDCDKMNQDNSRKEKD